MPSFATAARTASATTSFFSILLRASIGPAGNSRASSPGGNSRACSATGGSGSNSGEGDSIVRMGRATSRYRRRRSSDVVWTDRCKPATTTTVLPIRGRVKVREVERVAFLPEAIETREPPPIVSFDPQTHGPIALSLGANVGARVEAPWSARAKELAAIALKAAEHRPEPEAIA